MNIKLLTISLLGLIFLTSKSYSQSQTDQYYYLLLFEDKGLNYVRLDEPETFLSRASIERRKKFGIEIDSLDLPVTEAYIYNIEKRGVDVVYPTKWMNGVVVRTTEPDSARILLYAWYVKKAIYLGKNGSNWSKRPSGKSEASELQAPPKTNLDSEAYGKAFRQIDMLKGLPIHQLSQRGKGVKIAVFDEGFYKVDRLSIFQDLIKNNQIKYTLDLVDGDGSVYEDGDHGMKVLSCLAGSKKGKMTGTAPAADYYLFRTEDNSSEYLIEELNWIRAAEIADSIGIDIINSSLGYTTFDDKDMNHTWADLDGETTFITRGANIAASRGMLVVNSAGNDGNKSWKYLDPPADSKAILTVGAVDLSGTLAGFSSINEPSSFTTKPDVVAPGKGVFVANSYGTVSAGNGTSYACPITAGLCACLLELNPTASPSKIIRAVQKSSSRSYYPDNQYGYGIPSFELANTFLGGNPKFNYSEPQFLNDKGKFQSNAFQMDIYNKDYTEMDFWVTVKKRFIFFTYYKKLNHATIDLDESFTRIQAFVPGKFSSKPIVLKASLNKDGKKKTIYSTVYISEIAE
jgi:serine protease AprX